MLQNMLLIATQSADAASDPVIGFIKHFDYSVHFGDLMVTAVLTIIGHGLRKWYKLAERFFQRVDFIGTMTERNAIVIDFHTRSLHEAGIIKVTPEELDAFVSEKMKERGAA